MGKHARNKMMVNFSQDKNTASKKAVTSRKVSMTSTSTNYISQSRSSNESYILLTIFGPEESTQDESKEV